MAKQRRPGANARPQASSGGSSDANQNLSIAPLALMESLPQRSGAGSILDVKSALSPVETDGSVPSVSVSPPPQGKVGASPAITGGGVGSGIVSDHVKC
jgi:hypothetical protein